MRTNIQNLLEIAWRYVSDVVHPDTSAFIGPLHHFGVEDQHLLDLLAVSEADVNALIAHATFGKLAKGVGPFVV